MSEDDFDNILSKISVTMPDGEEFVGIIQQIKSMLDDSDMDDYFGNKGWKRRVFG